MVTNSMYIYNETMIYIYTDIDCDCEYHSHLSTTFK